MIAIARSQVWPIVLITNQSGIACGLLSWFHVDSFNMRIRDLPDEVFSLAAIHSNDYLQDATASSWRKPSPQMFLEAAAALNLVPYRVLIVGDRLNDLQAIAAAGVLILFTALYRNWNIAQSFVVQWYEKRRDVGETVPAFELQQLESLESFPLRLFKSGITASHLQ